jgi:hypothetical protein
MIETKPEEVIDSLTATIKSLSEKLTAVEGERDALVETLKWGIGKLEKPYRGTCEQTAEMFQKHLASLTPAGSKDDWCGWCKGRGERILVPTYEMGKCPDCDGTGTQQFKRGEHGAI